MRYVITLAIVAILAIALFFALDPVIRAKREATAYAERERIALQLERERRTAEALAPLSTAAAAAWELVPFGLLIAAGALLFDIYRNKRRMVSYGGLPVARHVIEQDPRVTYSTVDGYHAASVARARNAGTPERLTLSYGPRIAGGTHAPLLPADAPAAIDAVDVPSFSQLLDRGLIAPHQPLILGYTQGGMLQGTWKDLYSAAVAGLSGSGKTSTLRFLASQSALHGARFVVIDPHAEAGMESLAATLAPLEVAMLCKPADNEHSICDAVQLVQAQLDTRLRGNADRTPLILAVDELTLLMRHTAIAAELGPVIENISQQGRKVGIFCLASGQIWTADRSGGSALRDSLASVYCHRLRRNQARMLLSTEEARLAESLEVGQALLLRTSGECQPVSLPLATAHDVARVGAILETPRQRLGNGVATNNTAIESPIRSPKEAQVITMLADGCTVPDVVKRLYGETGRAYSDGVREVSSIISAALQRDRYGSMANAGNIFTVDILEPEPDADTPLHGDARLSGTLDITLNIPYKAQKVEANVATFWRIYNTLLTVGRDEAIIFATFVRSLGRVIDDTGYPDPDNAFLTALLTIQHNINPNNIKFVSKEDRVLNFTYVFLRDKRMTYNQAAQIASAILGRPIKPNTWRMRVARWAEKGGLPKVEQRKRDKE